MICTLRVYFLKTRIRTSSFNILLLEESDFPAEEFYNIIQWSGILLNLIPTISRFGSLALAKSLSIKQIINLANDGHRYFSI